MSITINRVIKQIISNTLINQDFFLNGYKKCNSEAIRLSIFKKVLLNPINGIENSKALIAEVIDDISTK